MAKKRINKRKFNHSNNDDKKSDTIDRKELKHLKTFGEHHPINDKKLCLEDLCVKRVFDDNNENNNDKNGGKMVAEINKTNKNQSEDEDESPTDYYEQLLDVFGKKKVDDNPESDASSDESTENDHSTNKEPREYEDIDVDQCDDDENDYNLNDVDNLDEDDGDDNEEKTNPIDDNFIKHFFSDFKSSEIESLEKALKQPSMLETAQHEFPSLGKFNEIHTRIDCFNNIQLSDHQVPKTLNDIKQIKPILKENIPKTMLKLVKSSTKLNSFQLELLSLITTYKNIYYPQRTMENSEQIRLIYSLHVLNHVLRTRQRIMLHNQKIKANKMKNEDLKDEYRDQGLTRPKVLILLPFKNSAYLTVNMLISLLFGDCKDKTKINLMNYKRFCKEFAPESAESVVSSRKPDDYKQLFAGNSDDSFRIGMAVTRKSFKLYSNFYQSDIIIASPLGLRMTIGPIDDDHDNGKNKKNADEQDYDFLSSIDIVIMDQSDIFLMQNWEHIQLIFDHLHLKPKNDKNFKNLNYLRVKLWTLELWSKYYYQLLMFNSISTTLLQGFFNKHSTNYGGRIIFPLLNDRSTAILPIDNIYLPIRQIFHHFDCDTHSQMADERFKFFTEKILPKFRNNEQTVRTMIYVPSYFDYVRLRNYFRREDISFTQICEYSPPGKVAKARHIFFYGGRHFLLYTERYHFFNRSAIKGIRHLIFYQPPTYGKFYEELINSMNQTNQGTRLPTTYDRMSVTILYNRKYDLLTILPLIGEKLSSKLLTSGTTATLTSKSDCSNVHEFIYEKKL